MSENKKIEANEANEVVETTEIAEATETVEVAENTATKYTIDYVLEQIAKLHADKEFYSAITNEFKSVMAVNSDSFAAAESAQAIGKAIMCRETTNQQLIAFYEKMYDDLKPASKANKLEKINLLLAHLSECMNDTAACYIGDELRRLMED
ncbi:MAG: hypothetical protein IJ386_02960 [Clostridia bacterium]|nr:hypothetical protein [Clostridia bacterium]